MDAGRWRRGAFALSAVMLLAALATGCGSGGGGGDNPTGEEVAAKVSEAINQPGMVYHAVASDGSEVWIDAADQMYLRTEATSQGTALSVGQGWQLTEYDPYQNAVTESNDQPNGAATPRIANPGGSWTEALSALSYGNSLQFVSKSTADGVDVYVVQALSPIVGANGGLAGSLVGRVEVDVATNLPHAFERHQTDVSGATPTPGIDGLPANRRITYTTSEMIARSSLPENFFDKAQVAARVKTAQSELDAIRALGLTPLWLGESYDGSAGLLKLPEATSISSDPSSTSAVIHYSLMVPVSATETREQTDSVLIRLSNDATRFTPPVVPQFAGALPENKDSVTVDGAEATLYTSILTPNDLGCAAGDTCPQTDAKLYRRLVFTLGTTGVQIEASARIGAGGQDANLYNDPTAIVALAEALVEAPPGSG